MNNEYTLRELLDPEELATARKALRLPPGDETLTVEQLAAWVLIKDTYLQPLTGDNCKRSINLIYK